MPRGKSFENMSTEELQAMIDRLSVLKQTKEKVSPNNEKIIQLGDQMSAIAQEIGVTEAEVARAALIACGVKDYELTKKRMGRGGRPPKSVKPVKIPAKRGRKPGRPKKNA